MKSAAMAKRVLCLALVLMLASMSLVSAFASSKKSYYVNVSRLNVRSGPSSSHSTTGHLKRGAVVTRYSSKNNWYYVKYSGGSGWVYKGYLSSVKSSKTSSSKTYKTTTSLNVRKSATTSSSAIDKLKKGKSVTVKKQKGSWAYVTYSGGSGWVSTKYLKRK